MSSKELAFLAGSNNILYLSNADGGGRITLNENVKRFQWRPNEGEIQITAKSAPRDSELSEFSVYRMPLEDVHTAERIGSATGSDTILVDRSASNETFSKGDMNYEYVSVNDSLYVKIDDEERRLIHANVHNYSLER